MDMISKSKLIHGTIAATMALSMTILPIAPASAEETVSAPESDYTGWVTGSARKVAHFGSWPSMER